MRWRMAHGRSRSRCTLIRCSAIRVRVVVAVGVPELSAQAWPFAALPRRRVADAAQRRRSLESATDIEPWGRGPAFAAEIDERRAGALVATIRACAPSRSTAAAERADGERAAHRRERRPRAGLRRPRRDRGGARQRHRRDASRLRRTHRRRSSASATTSTAAAAARTATSMQSGAGAARDDNGHGTHVSGIVAGDGATAPRGIAPGARIVAVKVLDSTTAFRSFTQIYRALEWIADERPDVEGDQHELRLVARSSQPRTATPTAIALGMQRRRSRNCARRGVLITASSGNQSSSTARTHAGLHGRRPRRRRDVRQRRSDVQTVATRLHRTAAPRIDLVAPGAVDHRHRPRRRHSRRMSGTSMAAPHVAGALALMQQVSGGTLTAEQVESILKTHRQAGRRPAQRPRLPAPRRRRRDRRDAARAAAAPRRRAAQKYAVRSRQSAGARSFRCSSPPDVPHCRCRTHSQHDLAEVLARLHQAMRFLRALERQHGVDHGPDAARFEVGAEAFEERARRSPPSLRRRARAASSR